MCKFVVQNFIIKDILKKKNVVHWISVRTIVQDFSIYETKRHILDNKIPYAIAVQDLIKEHKLENIEIETPTNYDTANILSILTSLQLVTGTVWRR